MALRFVNSDGYGTTDIYYNWAQAKAVYIPEHVKNLAQFEIKNVEKDLHVATTSTGEILYYFLYYLTF